MKYEREEVIERQRRTVAELYADRPGIKEWHPGGVDYRHLSGEPGRPGTKAELVFKGFTIVEKVKDRDLPDSFSTTYEVKNFPGTVDVECIFEELSLNSTKWTAQVVFKGFILRTAARRYRSEIEKEICEYMKAFKEFAEAEL